MIALFGSRQLTEVPIRCHRRIICRSWSDVFRYANSASTMVLELPVLDSTIVDRLELVRRQAPLIRLVLVTGDHPENARKLGGILVDSVIWSHELELDPERSLDRAFHGDRLLHRLILAVERSAGLDTRVRRALLAALEADPAPRTVKRWANSIGCTPRGLEKMWRRQVEQGPRPRDFLNMLAIVREGQAGVAAPNPHVKAAADLLMALGIESGGIDPASVPRRSCPTTPADVLAP